ncbi:hypothetical protein Hte_006481 [Hypoxylon texense]
MVGKVWSKEEEKYFWRVAVQRSAKRRGIADVIPEVSWDKLAPEMQLAMGRLLEPGEEPRRKYTGTGLFEHYFQNMVGHRTSPNAGKYVEEFIAKSDTKPGVVETRRKTRAKGKRKMTFRRWLLEEQERDATQRPVRRRSPRFSGDRTAAATPDGLPTSPSLSATTPAPVTNEAVRPSSPHVTRRSAKEPRPLRALMPAPLTGRVTKSSTPTRHNYNGSSTVWGYQMGKLHVPEPSSNAAPTSSAPYMAAPTQPATSPFPAPSYGMNPYAPGPPALNPFHSRGVPPSAREYVTRDPSAVGSYPAVGSHMGQHDMTMQPPAYSSYRYPAPIQANGKHPAMESSYAPRQSHEWENQDNRYPFDRPSSGSTSPNTYSAASILTNLTTARPDTTQSFPAQAVGASPYRNYNWAQQPAYAPPSYEPYPRTSTAPNSSHFQISPPSVPSRADRGDTVEEGLFVEDNEENETAANAIEDHRSNGGKHYAANQEVLDSIEVASTDAPPVDSSNAKGKEKAHDYRSCEVAQGRTKTNGEKRALNEWMDYSSESLDYDDVNDSDYVPGMNLPYE